MRASLFLLVLFIINVFLAIGLWQIHTTDRYAAYLDLSLIGVISLNVYNLAIFFLARHYSRTSNDKKYMHLIFSNFLAKLIIVMGIPTIYYFIKDPTENFFVIPFVVIYLIFTIFETWYLNRSAIMREG